MTPGSFNYEETPKISGYIIVPGMWNTFKMNSRPIHGHGFATYVLNVKLGKYYEKLSLKIKDSSSAYALWINNELVAKNGVVAKNELGMKPQMLPKVVTFPVKRNEIAIIAKNSPIILVSFRKYVHIAYRTNQMPN